jgi:restriction endonuclease S subunit
VLGRKKPGKGATETFKYTLLTLKSIHPDGYIIDEYLDEFTSGEKLKDRYITRNGDIVIRLSSPHSSVYIDENHQNILVPSLFNIIRLRDRDFFPEFLSIYLNSDKIKKIYKKNSFGTAVEIIQTSLIKKLNIANYNLDMQRRIIRINRLRIEENRLTRELLNKKNEYYEELFDKIFI